MIILSFVSRLLKNIFSAYKNTDVILKDSPRDYKKGRLIEANNHRTRMTL